MQRMDALRVYLIHVGATSFLMTLIFTVNLYFFVEIAKLNPLQLVLVGTALEISAFLFEIPTGIVADVYSRRLSIIISCIVQGIGLTLMAIPSFPIIIFANIIWGFGWTFSSGAVNAWITDEIGEEKVGSAFMKAGQVGRIAGLIAIPLSALIGSFNIYIPILLGSVGMILQGLFFIRYMPEHGFTPAPRGERSTLHSMVDTARGGYGMIKRRPILFTILLIAIIYGGFSEGYDRLWAAHMIEDITLPEIAGFKPVIWFGIINLGGALVSFGAVEMLRRRVNTSDLPSVMRALNFAVGLLLVSLIVFALAKSLLLGIVAVWLIGVARSIYGPMYDTWLNQGLDSKVRATVLSMMGQADALGQIAGGPAMGLVAQQIAIRAALLGSAAILSPILLLFRFAMRREQPQGEVEPMEVAAAEPA